MKLRLLLILFYLLTSCYSSLSQEYSYAHYDVKEGLAGSNVYCITQDKQGFLWMGTEGGVSRFDGTHFKNFTLEEGLPDIEVLQIFADSKGRIWLGPFSRSVAFYFNGTIHNQVNDPLLKKIHIRSGIESFAEDKDGNILIQESPMLHLVTSAGQVMEIDSIHDRPIISAGVGTGSDGHFLVNDRNNVYNFSGAGLTHFLSLPSTERFISTYLSLGQGTVAWKSGFRKYSVISLQQNKTFEFGPKDFTALHVSFSLVGDSLIYNNNMQGTTEYNLYTGAVREFLLGARISRTFRDDEGSIWFTSLGQGVFRLNSEEIRNIHPLTKKLSRSGVFAVRRADNELLVGTTGGMLFRFALPSFKNVGSHEMLSSEMDIRYIEKMKDGHLIIGTTTNLMRDYGKKYVDNFSVKTGCLKNDSEALVGGRLGLGVADAKTCHIKDTLFRERVTAVYYHFNTTYIGTIGGLYVIPPGSKPVYWGSRDSLLQKRISSITMSADSTLWVATYGGGIIAWKDGARRAMLTRKQGLSSDLCSVVYLHGNILWVGTDKGLNRVDIGNPEYPVNVYKADDGLSSDIINTIYADSSMVYVGTPAGLSFFDVYHVNKAAGCRLTMLAVINSGKDRLSDTSALRLAYKGNNIRFEYAGISYKSSGNIRYRYRLLGLDSAWETTNESFLDYPTLPSGDYELQLQAVNKFGISSRVLSLHFTVATPFWKTIWFDVVMVAVFVLLTWLFVILRIKHIRRRQAEQQELYKRMAETEHMALQAQMNPHFIFNCLNSIQQYIFDQDIFAANKYITGFARLIRATLNNSSKPFITLADEIDYLSAYLSLEKLRFKEKMNYSVDVHLSLDMSREDIFIPPMLIQPYVENCIRHGLRHRMGSGGYIRIHIMQEGDKLKFIIEDNGIGREQAARYKTQEHIEYQSRGMSLTADRIRLINTVNGGNIQVEVNDLQDQRGQATGTRVIIRFPRYDLSLQKNTIWSGLY